MTETERIAQLEEALRRMVIRIDRNAVWKRNEEDPDIVFARSVLGKVDVRKSMDIFVDDKRRTWCATDEGSGRILLSYKDYGNTFHWLVWDSADEDSALIKAHRELRVLRYKIRALENEISEEKKESNRLSVMLSRESVVFYSR